MELICNIEPMGVLASFIRSCLFHVLSVGPIPSHLAFIMDGNRRFAKKEKLGPGAGHKAGFSALMLILKYCYELGVKYVTVYAFSIDNFRRRPEEVKIVMDLMLEKIEGILKEESVVNQYGIRVYFLAYTSLDEIIHAVHESCKDKLIKNTIFPDKPCTDAIEGEEKDSIKLVDLEKHMYMALGPEPDVLIRTSGESRLSNFLLWQTSHCTLYSPDALWPEIGLWNLVWAVLNFQRNHSYLEKKKKRS
ncbi:dehydrodolichyl diphosphate synthase 6 isoform X2 [Jatropha curcas]|uniref:dehydrodolichyl diphosphate synthase 6 isoform X2 n=1 Tax=Jatropha curcas TaxID=180498 RepID=UPI0009D6F9F9|nr:dehydrodolichyl diphosphate synthase 6 isoform X2 [Jatropha curcas]